MEQLTTLEIKVLNNLLKSIKNHKKLLVALSGGRDSVALLNILNNISKEHNLSLSIAYINHNLRGDESKLEETFVRDVAEKYRVPLFIKNIEPEVWLNLKRESIEMRARRVRYNFFYEIIEKNSIDFIVTAHHLDDRIETFFLNLMRSPSLESLDSIPKKNGKVMRPLLSITRDEIDNYIKESNLSYIEDSTNKEDIYKRNIVRNRLIPIINDINSSYHTSFKNFFNFIEDDIDLIERVVKKSIKDLIVFNDKRFIAIDFNKYKKKHTSIKKRVVDFILKRLNYPIKPNMILFKKLLNIDDSFYYEASNLIITKKSSALWFINRGLFSKDRIDEKIEISKLPFNVATNLYNIKIELFDRGSLEKNIVLSKELLFSADEIDSIQIKMIDETDSFPIKKSNNKNLIYKNLKQHLLDSKIPKEIIKETVVIKSEKTTISYILNRDIFRVSESFFVTDKTKQIVKISLTL